MVKSIGNIVLYDVDDISKSLGMNKRVVRAWFTDGKLKGKKVGRQWMITEENLREFFNAEEGGEKDEASKRKPTKKKEAI